MNNIYDLFGLLINMVLLLSLVGIVASIPAIIVLKILQHREPNEKGGKLVRTFTTILGVSLGIFVIMFMKRLVLQDGPPSHPASYVNAPTTF